MVPRLDSPPEPPSDNKQLIDILMNKGVNDLRAHFDGAFWAGNRAKPTWEHLKIALLKKDKPKMRLLVTWGAFPTNKDMDDLKKVSGKDYSQYLSLLRQCGLRISPYALELMEKKALSKAEEAAEDTVTLSIVNGKYVDHRIAALPQEWLTVLEAVQKQGAAEAVIGGGALRDVYNERDVKDIDIFLVSRGSTKKNEKFLRKVVSENGFEVAKKDIVDSYFGSTNTVEAFDQKELGGVSDGVIAESWVFRMKGSDQEYNIVFVGSPIADVESYQENPEATSSIKEKLLEYFDFGLCQIACDGRTITTTPAYRSDILNQTITMVREDTDKEHLERIVAKYKDWKLCPKSKAMIEPPPPPAPVVKEEGTCKCGFPMSQCSNPTP